MEFSRQEYWSGLPFPSPGDLQTQGVGNMCATWIHQRLQIESSVRVSVGAYNTIEDIDDFVDIVQRIIK